MKPINFLFICLLFLTISCYNSGKTKHKNINREIKFRKDGTIKIVDNKSTNIASFEIEIADDEYERETGLMYRKKMNDNQAMLFIFDNEKPLYFYMKNTYIPLDIIFIDKNKKIVHIANDAKILDETTIPSKYPSKYVLEIKAGLSKKYGISNGQIIKLNK